MAQLSDPPRTESWRERAAQLGARLVLQRPSLQGRLLFVLVGLLVLLMALQLVEYYTRASSSEDARAAEHKRAVEVTAHEVELGLDRLYRDQEILGHATLSGRMADTQVNAYLLQARARFPGLVTLLAIEPGGAAVFGAPDPGNEGSALARPYLVRLGATGSRYLGLLDRPGRPPVVQMASVVRAATETPPLGVVAMEFESGEFSQLLLPPEEGQLQLLLDDRGHPLWEEVSLPKGVTFSVLARAARQARELRQPVALPEQGGAVISVPGTRWSAALVPKHKSPVAMGPPDTTRRAFFLSMVVVILALAILAVVQISLKPLVTFSAAARMLGSGDLSLRLPPAQVREFEPLVDAFNRMAGQLQAARDELVEANRNLESKVAQRTMELRSEAEKRLRAERLSTLGLLSSAIAHDLRNPLNTVSLGFQWLRLRLGDEADERIQARLDMIDREIRRAERIIQSLLAFARTGEPHRERVDVNALLGEVAAVVDPPPGVEVTVEPSPGLSPLALDRAQMFQVLENLARNAVQAMPEGGVVCLSTHAGENACRIGVSDTGPGIPSENQETIFEPLITTKSTGTGLGLALCKRIIEAHDGRIWVDSQPGEGATFWIELPLGG